MTLRNINIIVKVIFITILIASMDMMNLLGAPTIKILFIITFLFIVNKQIIVNHNIYFNKYIIIIFIFFTLNSLYLSKKNFEAEQTVIYIFIISSVFYFLIPRINLHKFIKFFIYIVYLLSIFALIQEIIFQIDNNIFLFSNASEKNPDIFFGILRVQSIFSEPNHFAMFLLPIVLIITHSLFIKDIGLIRKREIIIIFIAFFLTLSTGAFVTLAFVLLFFILLNIHLKNLKIIFMSLITTIIIVLLFNTRFVVQKIESALNQNQVEVNNKIPSGFGIFAGLKVSLYTLEHCPLFGYGFKNYSEIEDKLIKHIISAPVINQYSSKGLGYFRLIVEFGLIGILLLSWIILSNIIFRKNYTSYLIIVNHASLVYLIFMPIRFGQFTYTVYWFYFALFTISKQLYKKRVTI